MRTKLFVVLLFVLLIGVLGVLLALGTGDAEAKRACGSVRGPAYGLCKRIPPPAPTFTPTATLAPTATPFGGNSCTALGCPGNPPMPTPIGGYSPTPTPLHPINSLP